MSSSFDVRYVENGFSVETKVGFEDKEYVYKSYVFVKSAPMIKMFKAWVKGLSEVAENEVAKNEVIEKAPKLKVGD